MHQQARCDAEEVDATIGLQRQHGADLQRALPDGNPVTDLGAQRRRQALVDPGRPARRDSRCRRIGCIQRRRDSQRAAQRITGGDGLDLRQLCPQIIAHAVRHHARKGHRPDHLQAACAPLLDDTRRPRLIGGQQEIGTEQLVRLAVERLPYPVGEEADRGQRGHRHRQRRCQQAQLAAACITAQHAPGKGDQLHVVAGFR